MYSKTTKGFTKVPNWLAEICPPLESQHLAVLVILFRWTQGFHRKKWKFTQTDIAKDTGLHRNTIRAVMKDLKEYKIIDYESKKGAITMVEVSTQIPLFMQDAQSKCKLNKKDALPDNKQCTPQQQPLHKESANPPLAKDIVKEKLNIEDTFDFVTFKKNWFTCNEDNEPLRIQLFKRFDLDRVEPLFNSLDLEQQKQVCLGTKRFIQFLQNKPNEIEWIKNASNYILKEDYIIYFRAIKDELREETKRIKHQAYLKEAEQNKASEDEIKEALAPFLNRKENDEKK